MIPFCQPSIANYASFVEDQIRSEYIGPGKTTDIFADALAKYTRAPYVLLTTSGTVALQIALRTIQRGIEPGIVLCPAYGVEAVSNAFRSFGQFVDFIDVNRTTGCMDPFELQIYLQKYKKVSAVCYVDFSGNVRSSAVEVKNICKDWNVPFIEDAACGLGHWYLGKHAGTIGRIGTLSFSVPKLVTTGQGGAVLFEREDDYRWAKNYICQGDSDRTGNMKQIGCNLRFNDILASLGAIQLEDIDGILQHKAATHNTMKSCIPLVSGDSGPPLHNIVFPKDREKFLVVAKEYGIAAKTQYSVMTSHDLYKIAGDREFPNADYWNRRAVYLPFGNALTVDDARMMGEVLGLYG